MRLVLLVPALLATPLAAQSVRDRLEGRVPAEAIATIDSLVQVAAQDSLPTEPLVQKALEGGAKHVAAPRVVAAVQVGLTQLRDGRDLLVRAGDLPPVTPGEVTTVVWALRRGVPAAVVGRIVAALPRPPRAAAMHAVGSRGASLRSRFRHRADRRRHSPGAARGPAARRVHGGDPGAAARSHACGGARCGAPGAAQRPGRPEANACGSGASATAARPTAAMTVIVSRCNASSPRDARGTSRVSTVKRARVVRPIPPGGITT